MPYCCVVGCSNEKGKTKNVSFYKFPSLREREGEETVKLVLKRRRQWNAAVDSCQKSDGRRRLLNQIILLTVSP